MSSLVDRQSKFALLVGFLLIHAFSLGFQVTLGDAWAKTGHKKNSKHYQRLAIDLNLFSKGTYLTSTEDHKELGEYWESIGGTWGGRWDDGNHYEV